jgi:hypothetical protein
MLLPLAAVILPLLPGVACSSPTSCVCPHLPAYVIGYGQYTS